MQLSGSCSDISVIANCENLKESVFVHNDPKEDRYRVSGLAVSLGNPPGVPGALIDLILALEIAVFAVAWKGRPVAGT
ncbi:MAG: hypothetical protein ABSE39_03930 [Candidatus Bathyarchaeia archaeon]